MPRALFLLLIACVPNFAQNLPATFAPTGTLRAAFLGDNPALGKMDPKTGAVTGPVADIVKEIARREGVPFELIAASGGRDVMNRVKAGTADLGFLAYNAGRAMEVDFSTPWLMMPNTYLVPADSKIQKVADADRAGVHIQAVKSDTQDVYLSANLKNTKVDAVAEMPAPDELEAQLTGGKIDAFGLNRQRAVEIVATHPKLRVVSDNFFLAGQAIAVPKNNTGRLDALNKMLDEILAADFVKASIDRAGLKGVESAKPRTSK